MSATNGENNTPKRPSLFSLPPSAVSLPSVPRVNNKGLQPDRGSLAETKSSSSSDSVDSKRPVTQADLARRDELIAKERVINAHLEGTIKLRDTEINELKKTNAAQAEEIKALRQALDALSAADTKSSADTQQQSLEEAVNTNANAAGFMQAVSLSTVGSTFSYPIGNFRATNNQAEASSRIDQEPKPTTVQRSSSTV